MATGEDLPEAAVGQASEAPGSGSENEERRLEGNRKRKMIEGEATIERMSSNGCSTAFISQMLDISEEEVVAALVKRRKVTGKQETYGSGSESGAEASGEVENQHVGKLMGRLLSDPDDFSCPVLHALMQDPVVAADGFTYEREALQEHLSVRQTSPMTGENMGTQLVPNQGIKTKIYDYKSNLIQEVMLVAPRLAAGHADKLLARAEEFVKPRLPDGQSRRQYRQLLLLRCALPAVLRRDSIKELVMECLKDDDPACLKEHVLSRFDSLGLAQTLPSLDLDSMWKLFKSACDQNLPASTACSIGKDLSRILMAEFKDAVEVEERKRCAQEVWDVLSSLLTLDPPEWSDAAGAALPYVLNAIAVDLSALALPVLLKSKQLLGETDALVDAVSRIFGVKISLEDPHALGRICLELASRASGQEEIQHLLDGRAASTSCAKTRARLIEILSAQMQQSQNCDEALLLNLLFESKQAVPADLLPLLRLDPDSLSKTPSSALESLLETLEAAKDMSKAAVVAVAAAKQLDAGGDKRNAGKLYVRAYHADRMYEPASQGVVEMASDMVDKCEQLESDLRLKSNRIDELEKGLTKLRSDLSGLAEQALISSDTFMVDMSGESFSDAPFGTVVKLPKIPLKGGIITVGLRFLPRGHQKYETYCLGFSVSAPCKIKAELYVDDVTKLLDHEFTESSIEKGSFWIRGFGDIKPTYQKVGFKLLSLEVKQYFEGRVYTIKF